MASFSLVVLGLGLMALVSFAYSYVHQTIQQRETRHIVLGLAFGIAAITAMMNPIHLTAGVLLDGRALFVGFAGAFAGPLAALVSLVMGAAFRIYVGGEGALAGIVSMTLAAGLGLLWWHPTRSGKVTTMLHRGLMGFSFIFAMVIPTLLFLDNRLVMQVIRMLPAFGVFYVLATIIFGGFLEFERSRARKERFLRGCINLDPLTGVLNRTGLEEQFSARNEEATPNGRCLLLIELDDFDALTGRHGRSFRETALRRSATTIRDSIRSSDELARTGESEFTVLLMNVDLRIAQAIGERIKNSIRHSAGFVDIEVTASIGASYWPSNTWTLDQALQAADSSLFEAKTRGRDQLICRAG